MGALLNDARTASVLRWFGGKHILAKDIIPLFPEHHCYCEPFSGGAHVMMAKVPSRVEVFNDIDTNLVNFLMVLRERRDELIDALGSLPTSRYLFGMWQSSPLPDDPFERAVRWFYILRQKIIPHNNQKSGWRAGKIKNTAVDYQNAVQKLYAFEQRFRRVMIECLDFREVIRRYDSLETLFYVDPPYVGREHFYKGGFSRQDHIDLARLLNKVKGKVLVTYYADPLIFELYRDWHVHQVDSYIGTVCKVGEAKKEGTEYIFMNYEPSSV